jgi:hypothetical protein
MAALLATAAAQHWWTRAPGSELQRPYPLRSLVIDRPDQVWCAEINYITMCLGIPVLRRDHELGEQTPAVVTAIM